MAMTTSLGDRPTLERQAAEFERSLALLRDGDPERPLFVPWDDAVRARFGDVESHWAQFQRRWMDASGSARDAPAGRGAAVADASSALPADTTAFVAHVDAFVAAIEDHMSR